jgi:hypothetical protein
MFLFSILLAGFSCQQKESVHFEKIYNYKELYPSGKIKVLSDTINGIFEGNLKEFSENGLLNLSNNYKEGKLHGDCINYFSNGFPKSDLYYSKGNPQGIQYNFYETDSARVKDKFIFVSMPDFFEEPILVSLQKYNEQGDLIAKEQRVITYISKDTMVLGDVFSVRLKIANPKFDNYRLHIGDFNRGLILEDSTEYQSIDSKIPEFELSYTARRIGRMHIRGYIEDFKIESLSDGAYNEIGTLNNWFDIEYYVRNNR